MPPKKRKGLDPRQKQGALLDATGHSLAQIQSVLEVAESTVSRWRRDPEYQAEVEKLARQHQAAVEPLIARVKEGITSGMIEAGNMLRRALNATDVEGNPDYKTRIEAANAIARDFKGVVQPPAAAGGPGEAGAVGGGLTIVIGNDHLPENMAARPEHIDGLAEEEPVGELAPGG